jgi:hypothetical protein
VPPIAWLVAAIMALRLSIASVTRFMALVAKASPRSAWFHPRVSNSGRLIRRGAYAG